MVKKDQRTTQCCSRKGSGTPSPYNTTAAAGVFRYIGILVFLYTSFSAAAETIIETHKNGVTGGEQNMRLSNRQNWQLNKPRHWVYLILPSQIN